MLVGFSKYFYQKKKLENVLKTKMIHKTQIKTINIILIL